MSINIADIYTFAQLSTAGYVDLTDALNLSSEELSNRANSQERMPTPLGNHFFVTGGWRVLSDPRHPPETGGSHNDPSTGFSATLFQRGSTGEKVLSIRGTEAGNFEQLPRDIATDTEILDLGIAISQVASLFNLVQRLKAEPGQVGVLQVTVQTGFTLPSEVVSYVRGGGLQQYYWLEWNTNGIGVGGLASGEQLTVTGHSLGGHLAAMATRLFPETFTQAVVFNSARYDRTESTQLTTQVLDLFKQFGTNPAVAFSNVMMFDSEDQAPGDDVSLISSQLTGQLFGPLTYVTTEINSHVIEPFMDTLALHAVLGSMNGNFTFIDTGRIIEAIASTEHNTDERLLSALYKLLKGEELTPLTEFQASYASAGNISARGEFYAGLITLETEIEKDAALRLFSLVDISATDLGNISQGSEALSYRYALRELNPFVIVSESPVYNIHNPRSSL